MEQLEARTLLTVAPVSAALLKDLNTAPASPNPTAIVADGNNVFFTATAPGHQDQFWFSDGTTAGTKLLESYADDVVDDVPSAAIGDMTAVGGKLYYTVAIGQSAGHETQLWVSDGTTTGTMMLDDLKGTVANLTGVNGDAFFTYATSNGSATDSQLWKTSGTAAGTAMVDDLGTSAAIGTAIIYGQIGGSLTVYPGLSPSLLNVNGTLYFALDASIVNGGATEYQAQLWKSDGTATGTTEVHGFAVSASVNSSIYSLTNVAATVYLVAVVGGSDELYTSDGSDAGTTEAAGLAEAPTSFTALGDKLYFNQYGALWSSQGTAATTAQIASSGADTLFVAAGNLFSAGSLGLYRLDGTSFDQIASEPSDQVAVASDGTIYFAVSNINNTDYELWKSDGTLAGTTKVTAFAPATRGDYGLVAAGTTVFVSAQDITGAGGLWKSDGTAAGTVSVKAIAPPTEDSPPLAPAGFVAPPSAPINIGGTDYLLASYSETNNGDEANALWKTDGTTSGTVPLYMPNDLPAHANGNINGAVAGSLFDLNGKPIFVVQDSNGNDQLWTTDGTAAGTKALTNAPTGIFYEPDYITNLIYEVSGDKVYFNEIDPTSQYDVFWESDGTTAGTEPVIDASTGKPWATAAPSFLPLLGPNGEALAAFGGRIYSVSNDTATQVAYNVDANWPDAILAGRELFSPSAELGTLWGTNGTPSGTVLLATFSGAAPGNDYVAAGGGRWFFTATGTEPELWVTDGTAAGTAMLASFSDATGLSGLSAVGNKLVFDVNTSSGDQVWSSDGTASGTVKLAGFSSALNYTGQGSFLAYNNELIFQVGTVLWGTDGMAAGTASIKDVGVTFVSATALAGKLALSTKNQLWLTDGTAAGTEELADVASSENGAIAGYLSSATFVPAYGKWFFVGDDGTHGQQLWVTDGTAAGTTAITDVNPGEPPSNSDGVGIFGLSPFGLSFINGSLYFFGDDGVHGYAPWISDGTPAGTAMIADVSAVTALALGNSFNWDSFQPIGAEVEFMADDGFHGVEPWVVTPATPLVGAGALTLAATEGATLTQAVATFSDPNITGDATDYTATIDWGDKTSATAGSISGPDSNGVFTVSGSHVYAEQTTSPDTISIVLQRPGAADATVSDIVTVADAPLSVTGKTLAAQVNSALSGTLATFTDTGGAEALADYSATVNWGDGGSAAAATITGPDANGVFTISGSHTYTTTGTPTITITVHHDAVTPDVTIHDAVTVSAGPPAVIPTSAGTLAQTEGATFTAPVATFTDPNGAGALSSYSATIDWGDKSSLAPGAISGPDARGVFTVSGSHVYAEESAAPLTLSVVIRRSGSPDATVSDTVNVADAPLSVTGQSLTATANAALTGALATFTDTGGAEPLADYSATVDWGDGGSATAATISGPDAKGVFTISGSHTYTAAGTPTATITVHHDAVTPDAVVKDVLSVLGPVSYTSSGGAVTVKLVSGNLEVLAGTTVASSTPLADVTSLTVTGADGVANSFTLDYTGGAFTVPGGITFNGGTLPATPSNSLSIMGGAFDVDAFNFQGAHDGSIVLGTGGQVVNYINMTPLTNTGTAAKAVFKLPDGSVVASLDAGQTAGTVELVSGNGSFETTTLPAPTQSLTVNAGNGSDTVTTTNNFYNNFNAVLTVQGAANTLPLHVASTDTLTATVGTSFSQALATFIDPNGAGAASDYSATIDWGDGATTVGTVTENAGGTPTLRFTVSGTHTYTQQGSESPVITITHGSAAPVTATASVNVSDAALVATPATLTATVGTSQSFSLATFTDPGGAQPLSDYSATINWGDNTTTDNGTIALNAGVFTVSGTHTYAAAGTMSAVVTIDHGSAAPVTTTASIVVTSAVPFATSDAVFTIGSGTVSVSAADGLLKNDTGPTQLGVTAGTVTGAQGGTFTFNADGSFTYTPGANFPGYDSAPFTVSDASGDKATQTVTVLSQHAAVVWKFYESVLNRTPDPAGLQYWTGYFNNGGSTGDMAFGFFESDELLDKVLGNYYEQYLLRPLDSAGLTYWTGVWHATGGPEQIKAGFADSAEFYNSAGGTPQSWLTALYQRILNRTPDPAGQSFWTTYYQQQTAAGVDAGTIRYNIALGFFDSPEAYGNDVTGWFQEYLFRAPSSAEQTQYVDPLEGGATDRTIEQAITNLPEYANNPPAPADGSAAALPDFYQTPAQSQAVVAAKDAFFSQLS